MNSANPVCRVCAENLVTGENWSCSQARKRDLICRDCWASYLREWRLRNLDKSRAYSLKWQGNNLDISAAIRGRRRTREREALAPNRDDAAIAEFYKLAAVLTARFATPYHVDHVVPLSKGGVHHENNLVVMRGDYNCAKGAKIIPELKAFFCPNEPF